MDVNYSGKVHDGAVMKWIDQAAYACARSWAETYCVTVYVGGILFIKPISIGDLVKINAYIIYMGNTSLHIAIDVYSRKMDEKGFTKKNALCDYFCFGGRERQAYACEKMGVENG